MSEVEGRGRSWKKVLVVLSLAIVIQSITITLPIRGHVVDKESGRPVANAAVAAMWNLEMFSLHEWHPTTVRMAEAVTDQHGAFEFPTTIIIHTPVLPFSILARSDPDMPMLIVVADGYCGASASNDHYGIWGPPHASGLLSVRTSSLENTVVRLAPALPGQRHRAECDVSWIVSAVVQATSHCRHRWYCRGHALPALRGAVERGWRRAQF